MSSLTKYIALWKAQENIIAKCFQNLESNVQTPHELQHGLRNLREQLSSLNNKAFEIWKQCEEDKKETTKQFTRVEWKTASRSLIVSGVNTKKDPRLCTNDNGQIGYQFEAESSKDTLNVVRTQILPIFGLDNKTVEKAYRIPRPNFVTSKKPPRIVVTFNTQEYAHKILTNIRKLKNHTQTAGWHFDKGVPSTLRSEKKLGDAISYQFRKYNPQAKAKLNFPKNCLKVFVKRAPSDMWTPLSKEDMNLYTPMHIRAKNLRI